MAQANNIETPKSTAATELSSYDDVQVPPSLYKHFCYYAPDEREWTQRIFSHNEAYFAAPKDFNDPLDSIQRVLYPKSEAERVRFMMEWVRRVFPDMTEDIAEQLVRRTVQAGDDIAPMTGTCDDLTYQMQRSNGVFCMTEKNDNILMWAHYSGQHKGFCLEFRTDNPFFARARPVIYSRTLPTQDISNLFGANRGLPLYLVTKAEDWAYEKEWRLGDPASGPGPQKYPAESLTGVVFGCRMSDKDKEQIKEWCRARQDPPKFYVAQEKEHEYGLDIVPH